MARTNFDVGSIAALLRQTEANLTALKQPVAAPARPYSTLGSVAVGGYPDEGRPRGDWQTSPAVGRSEPGFVQQSAAQRAPSAGAGFELEAQIVQLRATVERLERKLEDELRSFLAVCDKRLQAKEEQLRTVGETLQVTADTIGDQLGRRVDGRLRELERISNERVERSMEEVWEGLRRLQTDQRGMEGKMQRCAFADELQDRLRESDRAIQQRVDEKLALYDRRAVEHRAQVESGSEAWREAISQRCHALEQRVWESQQDRSDLSEAVLKRLPESQPVRQLQEDIRANAYAFEVVQRRLSGAEAKLSKLPALESKVEFAESQTAQQLEEQAQAARGLNDVAQRLSQKLASAETACQRIESQAIALENRIQAQSQEDRERVAADIETLQQRLLQRVDDVEARLQRSAAQAERELTQQFGALSLKTHDELADFRQQAEKRFRDVQARGDALADTWRKQIELTAAELRTDARCATEACEQKVDAMHAEFRAADQSLALQVERASEEFRVAVKHAEQAAARMATEHREAAEDHRNVFEKRHLELDGALASIRDKHASLAAAHHTDVESSRNRLDALQARTVELESGSSRIINTVEGLKGNINALSEQLKTRAIEWASEAEAFKIRSEGLQARVVDVQVAAARAQSGVDGLKNSFSNVDGMKGQINALHGGIEALEGQLRSRSNEWAAEAECSKDRANAVNSRFADISATVQQLTAKIEGLKAADLAQEARSENLRSSFANLEVFVETLRASTMAKASTSDGAQGTPQDEESTDYAASVHKLTMKEIGGFREELTQFKSQLDNNAVRHLSLEQSLAALQTRENEGSTRASDQNGRMVSMQADLINVKSDLASMQRKTDMVEQQVSGLKARESDAATRAGHVSDKVVGLQEELRILQENVSVLTRREAEIAQQAKEQAGKLKTLLDELERSKRAASVVVHQADPQAPPGESAMRRSSPRDDALQSPPVADSIERRLAGVEELNPRLAMVEEKVTEAVQVADSIERRLAGVEELKPRLALLEEQVRSVVAEAVRSPVGGSSGTHDPATPDRASRVAAVDVSAINQRLNRLEEQLSSVDEVVENSMMAEQIPPGAGQPSQSTVVLTLNWDGELHESPIASSGASASDPAWLATALRGAGGALSDADVVRADLRSGPGGSAPSGVTCWLTATDARAAESQLRRQLADPDSALRRMLPGLVAEASSVAAQRNFVAEALLRRETERAILSRVEDMERTFTNSLGHLEHRVLTAERLAQGVIGIDSSSQELQVGLGGASGCVGISPAFDDFAELREEDAMSNQESAADVHQTGVRPDARTGARQTQSLVTEDDAESSRELNFEQASFDADAASQGGDDWSQQRKRYEEEQKKEEAMRDQRRRAAEEAAAAKIEEERRKAEEAAEHARQEQRRREEEERHQEQRRQEALAAEEARRKAAEDMAEFERRMREPVVEAPRVDETGQQDSDSDVEAILRSTEPANTSEAPQGETVGRTEDLGGSPPRAGTEERVAGSDIATEPHDAKNDAQAFSQPAVSTPSVVASSERPDVTLPRRKRVTGLPLVARASKRSKPEEIKKAFDDMDVKNCGILRMVDLRSYLGDHLGFGQLEAESFYTAHATGAGSDEGVRLDGFSNGYVVLNPFTISGRREELIIRKPGSLNGQSLQIEAIESSEVYICDVTAQVFVDECKASVVVVAPCESSVFVRDCENCVFWIAAQQLRTRDCKNCTFYLYSKTEPIIEASEDLAFAPWTACYPGCTEQFAKTRFDAQRNLWNAVYDFTGVAEKAHWRILPEDEVSQLSIFLDDPPEEQLTMSNPVPIVTHNVLCADPLASEESCGQSVGGAPQTRPPLPRAPPASFGGLRTLRVEDGEKLGGSPGVERLPWVGNGTAAADVSRSSVVQGQAGFAEHGQETMLASISDVSSLHEQRAQQTQQPGIPFASIGDISSLDVGADASNVPAGHSQSSAAGSAPASARTRVLGGMNAADDDASSDDGLLVQPSSGLGVSSPSASNANDEGRTSQESEAGSPSPVVESMEASKTSAAQMRRQMFGEDESSDDDGGPPQQSHTKPTSMMSKPGSALPGLPGSDDDDDVEDALGSLLASSRVGSSVPRGRGIAGAASSGERNPTSMLGFGGAGRLGHGVAGGLGATTSTVRGSPTSSGSSGAAVPTSSTGNGGAQLPAGAVSPHGISGGIDVPRVDESPQSGGSWDDDSEYSDGAKNALGLDDSPTAQSDSAVGGASRPPVHVAAQAFEPAAACGSVTPPSVAAPASSQGDAGQHTNPLAETLGSDDGSGSESVEFDDDDDLPM